MNGFFGHPACLRWIRFPCGPTSPLTQLGVNWKFDGPVTGERFAVIHHPMAPHALAAPLHRHHNEDEYSYVIRGSLGALQGDEVVIAQPGQWVLKPRGQWHTFWNAGDLPCEIIEVISSAGFEDYLREVAAAQLLPSICPLPNHRWMCRMLLKQIFPPVLNTSCWSMMKPQLQKRPDKILSRSGYRVTKTTGSVEALEIFRRDPSDYDLVITDMTMPKMPGDKLATEMIKIRDDIPVILLTGYSKKISRESALKMGIRALAFKPVQKQLFLSINHSNLNLN